MKEFVLLKVIALENLLSVTICFVSMGLSSKIHEWMLL